MGTKADLRNAAFDGAGFDKKGFCLKHPTCQLVDPIKIDGRICYEELRRNCPKCVSENKNKQPKRSTRSGGSSGESGKSSSRSSKPQRESRENNNNDPPFDEKGRCIYHKTVMMAAKRSNGGWKILEKNCPRCMEEGCDDDRSVRSGGSRKSVSSKRSVKSSGAPMDAQGQFDMNGCCVLHTHVQVAKKKMMGGWKILRSCPVCNGEEVDNDQNSVSSKNSRKSTRSAKSTRSTKSGKSKKSQSSKSNGQSALPFDGDGYCFRHPSVQIASKKLLGGWKTIHNVCPDCAEEAGYKPQRKMGRRKSGRLNDDNSDTSSIRSGKSASSSRSKKNKTKKVKNFRTEDENGYAGDYTGEVNSDYKPHGNGTMKYFDGNVFEGVWHEGSQVHGKARRRKSKF